MSNRVSPKRTYEIPGSLLRPTRQEPKLTSSDARDALPIDYVLVYNTENDQNDKQMRMSRTERRERFEDYLQSKQGLILDHFVR